YSGWEMNEQQKLFRLFRGNGVSGPRRELDVLESGMLRPQKSLLALFGLTRCLDKVRDLARLVPCESCSFAPCQYRRSPYRHARPPIEDVRRLQPDNTASNSVNGSNPCSLDSKAKYSINTRALRKWSQERLQLRIFDDRSVEARFRYEGTTCSN